MRAFRGFTPLLLLLLALPLRAEEPLRPKKLEIFSARGAKRRVKIYTGESVTFRAREKREGLAAIFDARPLGDVTFTLTPKRVPDETLSIRLARDPEPVARKEPGEELWGAPPSSFVIGGGKVSPDQAALRGRLGRRPRPGLKLDRDFFVGFRTAGRYLLEAEKPGFEPDEIEVDLAAFKLDGIRSSTNPRHHTAIFDLHLNDPSAPPRSIPVKIETLSAEGAVVDARSDVTLKPLMLRPGEFRGDRRVRICSNEAEGFRDRVLRRKAHPLPRDFRETKPFRIVEGGYLRITLPGVRLVYPLPL